MITSLVIALVVSIALNILTFWYMRRVLPRAIFMSRNLADLVALIANYKIHLKSIYEMELYYGDETMKFLMSHTNSLLEVLEEYEDEGMIMMPDELEYEEEETIGEEENAETKVQEENVFYAGSRRRDN